MLINYYRGGSDSIKKHRDSQPEFGENPTVLGISIGKPRILRFDRILYNPENLASIKPDEELQYMNREYLVEEGSLFIMAGATQKYFCHSIPKDQTVEGGRYSFTLRSHRPII